MKNFDKGQRRGRGPELEKGGGMDTPDLHGELGITLIETLLAIGVGSLLVIAAVSFYMETVGGGRTSQANQQVQGIVSGVHGLYASQSSYSTLTSDALQKGGVFPSDMLDRTTSPAGVFNPWRGTVAVAPAAGGSQFTIALTQVPQDACVSMLSTATSYGSGLVSVSAGSVVIPNLKR